MRCCLGLRVLLLALVVSLTACGGGGGPSGQAPAQRIELTGVATDGLTVSTGGMTVKGVAGTQRTNTAVAGTDIYHIDVSQLTAPYMLGPGTYTLALAPGVANATPLTGLVVAALFGQEPQAAFTAFGPGNAALTERVTEANLSAAQTQVLDFLTSKLGIQVPADIGSFITTPFRPVAGDPMFDLIQALQTRISALGPQAYGDLVSAFTTQARLCIEEHVDLAGGSAPGTPLCPSTKRAVPEDADPAVIAYVFETLAGEVLTVRLRGSSVLSVSYVDAAGKTFTCSAAACVGIAPGVPAADLSRALVFTALTLTGPGGTTFTLNGTLTGAVPSVVLPVLPCTDNRFFLVGPDRSVTADCVDIVDGANFFGIPGTLALPQGSTQFGAYKFVNQQGSNGLAAVLSPTTVSIVMDGGTLVSVTVMRRSVDPVTGAIGGFEIDYKCRAGDCNGVSVGPVTINTDLGIETQIRSITLADTRLTAVNADASLSTTDIATVSGSFTGLFISNFDTGAFSPLLEADCPASPQRVLLAPADEPFVFASCPDLVGGSAVTNLLPGGDLSLELIGYSSGNITVVTTAAGAVKRVTADFGGAAESFGCIGVCAGVSVSSPDASGSRTVSFTSAVLKVVEPDGFPTGVREAVANGGFVAPPPAAAALRARRGF